MRRLLSSIGIGTATVDTLLPTAAFSPGETVEAAVEIRGGSTEQRIDALYFALLTRGATDDRLIDQFKISEPFSMPAGETRTVTAEVTVPPWTPITRDDRRVWLKTGLDIAWAVDPNDEDDIDVVPGPFVAALVDAVEGLGFDYRDSTLREPAWLDDRPFVQAFRFGPGTDAFRSDIEALTLVCLAREDDLKTVVEIDEREPAEETTAVEFDRQEIIKTFETTNEDMIRRQLKTTIDRHTHTD